eukprot:12116253-Ditylum_brightwellii.AAC.1
MTKTMMNMKTIAGSARKTTTKPNPKTGEMKIDESGGPKGKPTENEKEGKTANNPVFIGNATG